MARTLVIGGPLFIGRADFSWEDRLLASASWTPQE
jgi:hypothetical protein